MELRFRPMFGGLMAYFGEKPCAWLSVDGLVLELAPADQPELLAQAGPHRMVAKPGAAPSRSYVRVPRSIHTEVAQLVSWLARAAAATKTARRRAARVRRRRVNACAVAG
ncbi:TfoX/Sxy family protein [Fulvimonas yonginensis]|uniref:TfoX/Sxy family protein n=1 Tax=Fulvimonas yonginensis TaxID=1495200 RepID=A0ABU8JFD5_9GAMM